MLIELNIVNALFEIVRRMNWEKLFFTWMDVYANLVYEFYSLLRIKTDFGNNILDYTMELWLHGKECR